MINQWITKFQSGEPLARVDPEKLKEVWRSTRKVMGTNSATGLGILGGFYSGGSEADVFPLLYRAMVVTALLDRGVLRDFQDDAEPRDAVFQVAANIAINRDDVSEAMFHLHLVGIPQEEAEQAKAEMLAERYSTDHAAIDGKFLTAIADLGKS